MVAHFDNAEHAFLVAMHDVTKQALATYPADLPRIKRAVDLILAGKVAADAQGIVVYSGSRDGKAYRVNGSCSCEDYQRGTERCKHRYAATLYRKAQAAIAHHTVAYTVKERDRRAADGDLVSLVCHGKIGEVTSQYMGQTETHAIGYCDRNGGEFCTTANR